MSATVQITPIGIFIDVEFTPLENGSQYDLDGESYVTIIHEGKTYRFYTRLGIVVDPVTGQMYRLDDESFQRLVKHVREEGLQPIVAENPPVSRDESVCIQTFGLFTPNLKAGMGFMDEQVSMELSLVGDVPIPTFDGDRWPTLSRELFIFPDGIQGSPDPMRLELSGEPCDVLGYMAALGVTDGSTTIDGHEWSVVFDEDQWADVFVDDVFFTSVSFH